MNFTIATRTHENPKFRLFISDLLRRSGLHESHIEKFTNDECMKEFTQAFTSKEYDSQHNYEFYEILGDATSNKIVVWYFKRRFPEIFDAPATTGAMSAVAIMSRLKQVGVSKQTYSNYARELGFWEFIRATPDEEKSSRSLLEDVFEAFIGCVELIIDTRCVEHSGYGVVYEFMKRLIDPHYISLLREDLYDPNSLLNEEKNKLKSRLITITVESVDKYAGNKDALNKETSRTRFESRVHVQGDPNHNQQIQTAIHSANTQLPVGTGPTKTESIQNAVRPFLKSTFFKIVYAELNIQ